MTASTLLDNTTIFPQTASVNSAGHLTIGGADVVELATEHGVDHLQSVKVAVRRWTGRSTSSRPMPRAPGLGGACEGASLWGKVP